MVVKMDEIGRSFTAIGAYCLHNRREPGEAQPENAERVKWTDPRNLATSQGGGRRWRPPRKWLQSSNVWRGSRRRG